MNDAKEFLKQNIFDVHDSQVLDYMLEAKNYLKDTVSHLEELNQKVEELENEMQEQCRIIGMSAERELSLISKIKSLEKENASLKQDASRLDWLDTQVKRHVVYSGYAWQEAGYESDRGLVCEIQDKRDRMSARQAIDTAMQSNNQ